MKRLSLKKIALVLLLAPIISWAEGNYSWADSTNDQNTSYIGEDLSKVDFKDSCTKICGYFYKGFSAAKIATGAKPEENTCTCTFKGAEKKFNIENNQ